MKAQGERSDVDTIDALGIASESFCTLAINSSISNFYAAFNRPTRDLRKGAAPVKSRFH